MIRTIISDLGNVLLHFDHMRACCELARLCQGSPREIYDAMFESNIVADYDLGRISSHAFARLCMDRLNLNLGMDVIRGIWSDIFHPVDGMEELFRFLKERYTLVLLSNTNEWHFEHCRDSYPVVSLFDYYALSYELKCRKPDPAIYRNALAMADAVPQQTLYVDDIPAFVEAAAHLGLRGICFQDRAQLTREMKSEGIACP